MTIQIPAYTDDQAYPFWYLRKALSSFATAGVVNPTTDLIVSPASGLQVQVTAGPAFVTQTVNIEGSSAYNGLYMVVNDATANPFNTITAPVTNHRIDPVILRVYDVKEQRLGGTSKGQIEWLVGSENASASLATMGPGLSNPGMAPLPDNSLVLAYVLQTVGEASISSGNILNVRSRSLTSTLNVRNLAGSATANPGDTIVAVPSSTITLPAPSAATSAPITITANSSVTSSNPVTVAGSTIWGVGLNAATSFLLGTPVASVTLVSFGSYWLVTSGQQDTGWVPLTFGSQWSASGTYTPAARVIGDTVKLRGWITNSSTGASLNAVTVPASAKPAQSVGATIADPTSNATISCQLVSATGNLALSALSITANWSLDGISYSLV